MVSHIRAANAMKTLRILAAALVLALAGASGTALAMSSNNSDSSGGSEFDAAVQAVSEEKWDVAVMKLNGVVKADSENADAHNYLGYAHRKLGDLDKAFHHYLIALKINPEHRGAHEYIGEAYLMAGKLAEAEAHLKRLDELCTFGCDEYYALKDAIANYRAKSG